MNTNIIPQKDPKNNDNPAVWDLVISDMKDRDRFGFEKYKTHLQSFNGRDALVDLYQELLDAVVYIRQLIYERENERSDNRNCCCDTDGAVCNSDTDT